MIISHLCGGLGNQMFQYAAGRRLAISRGAELKLDASEYRSGAEVRPREFADFRRALKLYELKVTAPPANDTEIAKLRDPYATTGWRDRLVRQIRRRISPTFGWPATHVRERQYRFDPRLSDLPGNVYLQGFWQSWRYFADMQDVIRAEFAPRDESISNYAAAYVDRIRQQRGELVAVHIRRGDMAHAYDINRPDLIHTPPVTIDYIHSAMQRFGPRCQFLIFSDTPKDIEWCRQNIKPDWLPLDHRHFAEGHSDIQDMAIMSVCDHNVIANSTFSWWAAWLNNRPGRRVVAPTRWSAPGAALAMVTDDLIPPDWEVI